MGCKIESRAFPWHTSGTLWHVRRVADLGRHELDGERLRCA